MKIAIVGLGTAGACMLDSLEQSLGHRADITLTLYDEASEPWVGRVFQADGDWVLANAPATGMSVRHGDPTHAERWLVQQGRLDPRLSADTFLPRSLYGRYLSEHAALLVDELRRRGWQVDFVRERATSLEPIGSRYALGTAGGRRDQHDYVILAAGGSVLADPYDLASFERFVADPYPTRERLAGLPSTAAVGIVGSGLTAVDTVIALRAQGHEGPVAMYSRSAVLPFVRRPGIAWVGERLTADRIAERASGPGGLRLADVEKLLEQEVRAWGGEPRGLFPRAPLTDPAAWLKWQLERPHDRDDLGTYIFQKTVPFLWGDIWYALRPEDKRRLAAGFLHRDVMSRCCPMPGVNAEKVLAMLESGQLRVRAGLKAVLPTPTGFELRTSSTSERVDHLVNAVTPRTYGIHPDVRQLVDGAVGHGLAARHEFGGLEVVGATGAVRGTTGGGRAYALGDLTRGAFFFIFGVPALVRRSADIARAIGSDIDERTRRTAPVPVGVAEPVS